MTDTYARHSLNELFLTLPDKYREQKQLPLCYTTNSADVSRVNPVMAEDLKLLGNRN